MSNYRHFLRRYTNLESLRCILYKRRITLLDPQTWKDDSNDSYYLSLYKKDKELKSLLALCLTKASERYHLWRTFCPGFEKEKRMDMKLKPFSDGYYDKDSILTTIGVRIRFDRDELIMAIRDAGANSGSVMYQTLHQIEKLGQNQDDYLVKFPYYKRYGFRDEREYRIIYESKSAENSTKDIPISLSCIDKVILSPWLDHKLFTRVKDEIHSIHGCEKLKISHSSLTDSKTWKKAGEDAIKTIRK
jgi:hypothetical protein